MARYAYPAVFHPNADDGSFTVTFPDLPGCITEGKDIADALYMAKDALEMWLWCTENRKETVPLASAALPVETPEFVNLIYADTEDYRRRNDSRAVKKTLSIPAWLNERAIQAGVNFSQVLQEALKERLDVH